MESSIRSLKDIGIYYTYKAWWKSRGKDLEYPYNAQY
jgi:hypothetical protein